MRCVLAQLCASDDIGDASRGDLGGRKKMATQLLCGNLSNPSLPSSLLRTWEIFMELTAELESETSAVYKDLEKCHY